MIESRIKRALWAITILIVLGFGGHSAYNFYYERIFDTLVQKYSIELIVSTEICKTEDICNSIASNRELLDDAVNFRNEAVEAARQSLNIAIGIPIALWIFFFLFRWIWTGKIQTSQSPATEKRPFFTKQVLYWGTGILGFALIFALNVLVLPSGRALHALISSAVNGAGLILVVWLVSKIRDARQKRTEQKRAAEPVSSANPLKPRTTRENIQ